MSSDAGEKKQFLHRGRRYLGLWILPGEYEVISEAAFRVGKSKNGFIMQAVKTELDKLGFKDLSEVFFETRVYTMRKRANPNLSLSAPKVHHVDDIFDKCPECGITDWQRLTINDGRYKCNGCGIIRRYPKMGDIDPNGSVVL